MRFGGTTATSTQNDFDGGTPFGSIEFASGGFVLSGNAFTATEGIRMDVGVSDATISADVALDGCVTIDVADPAGTLTISGDLSGSGGLTKSGPGALALNGAIGHTGSTTVLAGTIVLPPVFSWADEKTK